MSAISKQIGKYKAASKTRNIGSKASSEQMSDVRATSRGDARKTITSGTGSLEGYHRSSSTYIQGNNTGYLKTQRARRSGKQSLNHSSFTRHSRSSSSGIKHDMIDYRYGSGSNTSRSILESRQNIREI